MFTVKLSMSMPHTDSKHFLQNLAELPEIFLVATAAVCRACVPAAPPPAALPPPPSLLREVRADQEAAGVLSPCQLTHAQPTHQVRADQEAAARLRAWRQQAKCICTSQHSPRTAAAPCRPGGPAVAPALALT